MNFRLIKDLNYACLSASKSIIIQSRSFAVTGRHSKKVALTKNKQDAAKNKLFTRLGVKILMAAKAGGVDASKNPDLARVLKEAASIKLPKDNIERALHKASDTSTESYGSGIYEVFGFGGVGLIVCSLTNNPNRAVKEIKALVKKADAKIASSGSVLFQFEQKAVFVSEQPFDKDQLVESALAIDMSDIQFFPQNSLTLELPELIVANVDELALLQDITAQLQLAGASSLAYLPTELIKVSAEDLERNSHVIEELEELEDVDVVYHNMMIE